MTNLFFITETVTNNFDIIFLYLLSILAVIFATFVIIIKNPVYSIICLIALFLDISLYLFLIDITFIALAYILVYVGAVSILFLFILMLINIRISELLSETKNSIPLVIFVSLSLSIILGSVLNFNLFNFVDTKAISIYWWDNSFSAFNQISAIGNILYVNYFIWLLVTSVILLLAMVGAIVITLKPKKTIESERKLSSIMENSLSSGLYVFIFILFRQ